MTFCGQTIILIPVSALPGLPPQFGPSLIVPSTGFSYTVKRENRVPRLWIWMASQGEGHRLLMLRAAPEPENIQPRSYR